MLTTNNVDAFKNDTLSATGHGVIYTIENRLGRQFNQQTVPRPDG